MTMVEKSSNPSAVFKPILDEYLGGNGDDTLLRKSTTTLSDVFESIEYAERMHASSSRSRRVSLKIKPLVDFIERYAKAVDCFVQGASGSFNPIAIIWGALRALLEVASSVSRYFPKLLDMLERLGTGASIYEQYEELFGNDPRFSDALSAVYCDTLKLLLKARQVFKKRGLYLLIRGLWATFESDFQDGVDNLSRHQMILENEATLAHRKTVQSFLKSIHKSGSVHPVSLGAVNATYQNQEIVGWLDPVDTSTNLARNAHSRTSGTGNWLLRHNDFMAWKYAANSSVLWLHGRPGTGKTILATTVIQHLQESFQHSGQLTAFFFCDKLEAGRLDMEHFVTSILAQICAQSAETPPDVVKAFRTARNYGRDRVSLADRPLDILRSVASSIESLYLIVDGVDEFADPTTIIQVILELTQTSSAIHSMIISRDLPKIRLHMEQYPNIPLLKSQNQGDIETFVLEAAKNLLTDDVRLRETVIRRVSQRADGMFLWSRLAMNSLSTAVSPGQLIEMLEEVPPGLSSFYTSYLQRLDKETPCRQDLAAKLLRWSCSSRRPLHVTEMQCALAGVFTEEGLPETTHTPFKSGIIELGYPLVLYRCDLGTLELQHLSVRDFFLGDSVKLTAPDNIKRFLPQSERVEGELASTCLQYLIKSSRYYGPLTKYTTLFWYDHLLKAAWDPALYQLLCQFMDSPARRQQWISRTLVWDQRGFSLQKVFRIQVRLEDWARQGGLSVECQNWDFPQDTIQILLRANDDGKQCGVDGPRFSYFEKLMVMRDLSRLLKQGGRICEGVKWFEDSLEEQTRKNERPEKVVWILNSLGILYDQTHDVQASLKTQTRALLIQEAALGTAHLQTLWTVNELGRIYRHMEDFEKAIQMHTRALRELESVLPDDHLETIWTINTLARAYRKQGQAKEALTLHQRAFKTRSRVLGEEHPHTLWVLGDIAQCHRDLGVLDEAEVAHRKALQGRIAALGAEHPDTLWTMNDLGVILAESGKHQDAFDMQKLALDGQMRVLGVDHAHTSWTTQTLQDLARVANFS